SADSPSTSPSADPRRTGHDPTLRFLLVSVSGCYLQKALSGAGAEVPAARPVHHVAVALEGQPSLRDGASGVFDLGLEALLAVDPLAHDEGRCSGGVEDQRRPAAVADMAAAVDGDVAILGDLRDDREVDVAVRS